MLRIYLLLSTMYQDVMCMPVYNKNTQLSFSPQICNSQILRNGQLYQYCQKEYSLSSRVQSASITQSSASAVHLSLYTTTTQNLILNLTYSMQNLPSFSLFGLTNAISLQNSVISVKIPQDLSQGSLLCLACDVTANASDFTFVASGQNVSGAVLTPLTIFQLNQSLVQFRLNGLNVGGLVLNASNIAVTISICNISGHVGQQTVSGSIICFVFEQVSLGVDDVRVCANVQNIGQGSLSQTGTVTITCVVCREGSPAYGLCQKSLEFGTVEDDKFVCPTPFVFDGEGCSCQEGQVINGTTCVNVLASVNLLKSQQIEINNSIVDLSNRTKVLENITEILNASQVQMKLDIQNLYQLSNQTQNSIEANQSLLQQFVLENYTKAENNLYANTTVLDKRIFDNITILSNQMSTLNATSLALNYNITELNQTLNTQKQLNQLLTQNITLLNQSLISSYQIIQQQQQVIGDLNLQVQCLNNGYQFENTQCITNYSITCSNPFLSCGQQVFIQIFDITSITHQVIDSGNFTNSYVFSTATVITHAFIDVSNNVYSSTVYPLFQTQSNFTNLKIQFGAQTLNSGSLISTLNSQITINQMNIVSRPGSQLIVTANSQLNILTNSPVGADINNLLVNLSFALSAGNITLINNINGAFNISGYQVLGDYNSTLIVAMIGINVQTATINLNQVSFKPNTYNVGNESSYLFGSTVSGASSIEINHLAIIIGNSSNFQLLGSITTSSSNYYRFGGIIAFINTALYINVNSVILDSCQKFSTGYVQSSGFLVGKVDSSSSNVTIKNVCLQQNMTSTTTEFLYFGLIGRNIGNTSIQNASVTLSVQGRIFNYFGIVGIQSSSSLYAKVINLRTSVSVSSSGGNRVGSVFGYEAAKNCSVQNASLVGGNISGSDSVGGIIGFQNSNANVTILNFSVQNSNISDSDSVGGIIGFQNSNANVTILNFSVQNSNISGSDSVGGIIGFQNSNANATILDSSVQNSIISGSDYVGGIIGYCLTSKLYLTDVQIKFVRITGSSSLGVVVGYNNGGTYSFITSTASSNYINGVLQTDCASLSNTWSVSGC
ncbi:inverse_autotransporter beta-barrel domain-containing protein [Hexamita inflata]|uniref:Inverse autotransporter beta-barrel domain-containing protein n=1 Tax=Hexamita inflata TaxID=28002 RepID=A0AA86NM94_9EUKA|nr:inverse autotransporter beta-barrel domain-containing protein [Hexamita inflata]